MSNKISDFLDLQRKFSNECFNLKDMSKEERIEKHKVFCLALHDEATQLANAVHFKDHRQILTPTHRQKVLYESIDIFRYALATLNLWEFSSKDLEDAFYARDAQLWDKKKRSLSSYKDQPTIIVDVDDVIAKFRDGFFGWLNKNFDLNVSPNIPEYYYSGPVGHLTGEEAFSLFIEQGGFRDLKPNNKVVEAINRLKSEGFWIQLLTARPENNLKCMYDTYIWLDTLGIKYDNIAFSFEKYRWLTDKSFFKKNKIICAIDDSPKHASEYASQGIKTFVPKRSYNGEVWNKENIITFDWNKDNLDEIIKRDIPGIFLDT